MLMSQRRYYSNNSLEMLPWLSQNIFFAPCGPFRKYYIANTCMHVVFNKAFCIMLL